MDIEKEARNLVSEIDQLLMQKQYDEADFVARRTLKRIRTHERSGADELRAALKWALPIVEAFLAIPDIEKSMNKLNFTAEPNLSKARAALAKHGEKQ